MKTFNEAVEKLTALAIKVRDNTDWNDVKSVHNFIDSLSFGDGVYIEISTETNKRCKNFNMANGFLWFTIWNEQIDEPIDEQDSKDATDEEIRKAASAIIACNQVYLGLED